MTSALHHIPRRTRTLPPLRVGIGGPVGSGKTTLLEMLCKAMRDRYDLVAITNDIYTKEDQRLLTVSGALYFNDYPVADVNGVLRNDDIWSGGAGVAYFFTPLTFLSVDYRHDRRSSNIDVFGYESNALQLMMGFGFLNR